MLRFQPNAGIADVKEVPKGDTELIKREITLGRPNFKKGDKAFPEKKGKI